jgi:hypothetical protein
MPVINICAAGGTIGDTTSPARDAAMAVMVVKHDPDFSLAAGSGRRRQPGSHEQNARRRHRRGGCCRQF